MEPASSNSTHCQRPATLRATAICFGLPFAPGSAIDLTTTVPFGNFLPLPRGLLANTFLMPLCAPGAVIGLALSLFHFAYPFVYAGSPSAPLWADATTAAAPASPRAMIRTTTLVRMRCIMAVDSSSGKAPGLTSS